MRNKLLRGTVGRRCTVMRSRPSSSRYSSRREATNGRWYLDELVVTIQGQRQHLWRAVDQGGDVIDIPVRPRRDRQVAVRFFRRLLKGQGRGPRRLTTDKLRRLRLRRIGGRALSVRRQLDSTFMHQQRCITAERARAERCRMEHCRLRRVDPRGTRNWLAGSQLWRPCP